MTKQKTILKVRETDIAIVTHNNSDFICLSDMTKGFDGGLALIEQWLRNKDTIEVLGLWEQINNSNFNSLEFEGIKNSSGTNRFYISVKRWIDSTNAVGIISKAGR